MDWWTDCTNKQRCTAGILHHYHSACGHWPLSASVPERICIVPRTHNSFGDRSFSAAGPRMWNALPLYVRQDTRYKGKDTCSRRPRHIVTVVFVRLRSSLTYLLTYFIPGKVKTQFCLPIRLYTVNQSTNLSLEKHRALYGFQFKSAFLPRIGMVWFPRFHFQPKK